MPPSLSYWANAISSFYCDVVRLMIVVIVTHVVDVVDRVDAVGSIDWLIGSIELLCFRALLSCFAFTLCFRALLSRSAFVLCFRALLSCSAFVLLSHAVAVIGDVVFDLGSLL